MKIRFLGTHNAESKHSKLVTFLIDEILAVEAGSLASELTFAEQKKIKAILLSHGHYDHIKELPAFAFGNSSRKTRVFGTKETLEIFSSHLADGVIYPDFARDDSFLAKSVLDLRPVKPFRSFDVQGYHVLPVPVQHPISAVGFEITKNGNRIFYTGDAGPGLTLVWKYVRPTYLITELTFPNRLAKVAEESGHLCPETLKRELAEFERSQGYLPRVSLVHLTPEYEQEIAEDVKAITEELSISIKLAAEGDEITV